ncbi:MAG: BlaI/MecI/CopY family transcriptional regulator [Verrucomicrobiota bacterium]
MGQKAALTISEAEWQIMEVVWRAADPMPSEEILRQVENRSDWSESTMRTFLNRLGKKGAICAVREGRRYLYSPACQREECLRHESTAFLKRYFDGKLSPMLACFLGEESISEEELDRLEELVKRRKKELS